MEDIEPHEIEQLKLVCNMIKDDPKSNERIQIHEASNGLKALEMFKNCS